MYFILCRKIPALNLFILICSIVLIVYCLGSVVNDFFALRHILICTFSIINKVSTKLENRCNHLLRLSKQCRLIQKEAKLQGGKGLEKGASPLFHLK